jgi:uncharacterized protein (TIGR03067 family)
MRLPLSVVLAGMLLGSAIGQSPKDAPKEAPKTEAPKDSPAAKDTENLQGEWKVTHLMYNGKDMTERFPLSFVFKGDMATLDGNKAVLKEYPKLKFKLDPSTTPKLADVTVVGGTQDVATLEGIYELKGDDLQICLKVFAADRPSEFDAPAESSNALLKLKRQK